MKCKRFLLVLLFIMVTASSAYAFDGPETPCGDGTDVEDPFDNNCPLDSWVYLLVLAPVTITLTTVLYKATQDDEKKSEDD